MIMDTVKQGDQIRHSRVTPFSIDDILGKCRESQELHTKPALRKDLSCTVIQRELRDIQCAVARSERRRQLTHSTEEVGREDRTLSASGIDKHDILSSCWKMTEKLERDARESLEIVSRGSTPSSPILKGKNKKKGTDRQTDMQTNTNIDTEEFH